VKPIGQDVLAQYMVLVMCRDEKQQLDCKALPS
jgi:hypothetical protein